MSSAPTKSGKAGTTQPRWGWSGVSKLKLHDQEPRVQHLLAMLPSRNSGDDRVLAYLAHLRAHFQGWLNQDEFGPTRKEQTACLRALMKSVRTLLQHLTKGASRSKSQFDTALRARSDPTTLVMASLQEAAADVYARSQIAGATAREAQWISRVKECIETFLRQTQVLDDNSDGHIQFTALRQNFDLSQVTDSGEFGSADAERWLNVYWSVLVETLDELTTQRGGQERVSLKLLVEELCRLWERETGQRVTAHGLVKDTYTQRVETDAGRFVTAAVEAMLPDKSWFDEHAELARSVRAETFWPGEQRQADRARQILVIMREFVKRRSRQPKN